MAINAGVCRPARRRRRIARAVVYPSLILAAAVSGCSSPRQLHWPPSSANPGRFPAPGVPDELVGAPKAADVGVTRTAGEGPAPERRTTPDTAPVIPAPAGVYPIDLTTALRLAEVENPRIAEARQRIGEALALQQKARVLLLPNLNAGTNYHSHTGNLQRSSGTILKLDQKSLYFGGGAGAVTAGTVEVPAVNISTPLTEAIFEPLAARQRVDAVRFEAAATANRTLLEVAVLHFDLLAAEADLRVRILSAEQEAEVARMTRAYAEAKQGREADAQRAETELRLVEREVKQAEEAVAVASARLTQRLHLDQNVRLHPVEPGVEEVTIVDPNVPLPDLIQVALRRRPEIGSTNAAVGVAEARRQQEQFRPILPTLWLGFSAGVYGGGSNLVGNELSSFRGRTDFDVMAYWTLRNLGVGNVSLVKQRRAEVGQAVGARSAAIAEARSQVAEAYAEVISTRQRVELANKRLASAEKGFQEDLAYIQNTVGRPIEQVNSLRLLNEARVARIRAVTEYNQAEFRLFVALGSPPPLAGPPNAPLPPAPIASPPLPPLAAGSLPAVASRPPDPARAAH